MYLRLYVEKDFEKKKDLEATLAVSQYIAKIVPNSLIYQIRNCIDFSFPTNTKFLTYILPFKRQLNVFKDEMFKIVDISIE
ncbi:hypothetical protein MXB_2812 [Myxobolus squamalis]|nr:hypothetical protein MXB_2812 [Myxobolus squamalis]